MLNDFWSKLKSGSDIRGVATDGVSGEKIELTNETVQKISLAFATWIKEAFRVPCSLVTVAVGHDSRISSLRIKNAMINSLRSVGINVYDCGLTSTPAMFMATSVLDCLASVQITASHHPFNRNGFKFFTSQGGFSNSDIEEVLNFAQTEEFPPIGKLGSVRSINLMNYYSEKLIRVIKSGVGESENRKDSDILKGFKIVVDAGNGAGGFFVEKVLKLLGADTEGSRYLEPDGNFPNHIPNPEDPQAMQSIVDAVKKSDADLGIIFDTDVDRVAFVGKSGREISKNKLIALASTIALKDRKNGVIVTDSMTSDYLKKFIENLGGVHFRYKRGYQNVIGMAKKLGEKGVYCPLAIESSGHAAFKENDFVDDGAFFAAKIIVELVNAKMQGKNVEDLISSLIDAKESASFRIKMDPELSDKILADFKNYARSNKLMELDNENIEGVRVNNNSKHQKGWVLLRKSIHDPVLIVYAESYVTGGVKPIVGTVHSFLNRYKLPGLEDMEKFLGKNKNK